VTSSEEQVEALVIRAVRVIWFSALKTFFPDISWPMQAEINLPPSLSKTGWIVTGIDHVRVQIAWRPGASYLCGACRKQLILNSVISPVGVAG
jgi:hypothetical protein